MAVTASIFWQGEAESVIDVQFAYPLAVGSYFALRTAKDNLICTVELIVHYPTNVGSEHEPTVAYFVKKTPAKTMKNPWWQVIEAAKGGMKELFNLNK